MPIRPETENIIKFLNDLTRIDLAFMGRLIAARVPCNDEVLHHPTVQAGFAGEYKQAKAHNFPHQIDILDDDQGVSGFLGVLNGYCGAFDDGPKKGRGPSQQWLKTMEPSVDLTLSQMSRADPGWNHPNTVERYKNPSVVELLDVLPGDGTNSLEIAADVLGNADEGVDQALPACGRGPFSRSNRECLKVNSTQSSVFRGRNEMEDSTCQSAEPFFRKGSEFQDSRIY